MGQLKAQLESTPQAALSFKLTDHGEPLKLLQLSDCHFLEHPGQTLMGIDTEESFKEVLSSLQTSASWPPDLILLTGDLVQDPSPSAYERLLCHLNTLEVPWVALCGNHDDPKTMAFVLCQNAKRCARRILTKTWQILCLNSHLAGSAGGYLAACELEFLALSLEGHKSLPALIAVHHPPLAVHSAWMDTMLLANGPDLLILLERFPNVKGLIFGHVHQEFAGYWHKIPLWSAPSTCFQFRPGSSTFALDAQPPGWRWLKLYACGQIHTWVERLDHLPSGLDFSLPGY